MSRTDVVKPATILEFEDREWEWDSLDSRLRVGSVVEQNEKEPQNEPKGQGSEPDLDFHLEDQLLIE